MERAMSVEERIRRAENIYNRKNGIYSNINRENSNAIKPRKKMVKKMLTQIFVCLTIYTIFYATTNSEYVFSEQFRNNISSNFENVKEYIEKNILQKEKEIEEPKEEVQEPTVEEPKVEEPIVEEENVGGAEEEQPKEEDKTEDTATEEKLDETAQMKKDAEEIKKKINFIVPVNGRISSTFGLRNPTTSTVPKNHTGLDIAANEGTKIKSATDGKVILASSTGDYGNHYQIQIDDVIIIYAHCKKLYLKQGDTVKQGQEIAEVGSTGNSTGPHLHFEIRKGDRKVDPQLILNI